MEIVWDQFKEAFWGHYVPAGLMTIKHTEFMKLTQGDKSVTEYLHAFISLSRYAPDFVNMEVKKIACFKRGLCPKLMKAMCNSKCATFNEFVSDTILQENCNAVYAASKSHDKSHESNAPMTNTLDLLDITHIRHRIQSRGAVLRKETLRHRQVTGHVGIARCQVIGPEIVLSRRRSQMIIR
jgi:hypothetical protein